MCYVDDFIVIGDAGAADELYVTLSKHVLLKKTGLLCDDGDHVQFLGRALARHGDMVSVTLRNTYVDDMLATLGLSTCKLAKTPGSDTLKKHFDGSAELLDKPEHKTYRTYVGKLLWLSNIRPDISFAVKKLSRYLSCPTVLHFSMLTHLLRYLKGSREINFWSRPTLMMDDRKPQALSVVTFVDSDWAGCHESRKSTTGVVVTFLLGVTIQHISRTQTTLVLSSAEAELYAIGLGVSESLFVKTLLIESRITTACDVTLYTDSSAAKSMVSHFGSSKKAKLIELHYFYYQDLMKDGIIILRNVLGTQNPADILTKNVNFDTLSRHLTAVGILSDSDFIS